jgi:hypothetical protein
MTVQTICDTCGMEYFGPGVTIGGNVYCCAGCARGGPCNCGTPAATGYVAGSPTVIAGPGSTVIANPAPVFPRDDVVIIE